MRAEYDMDNSEFRPEIIHREGMYCVYLPEWNLSADGKTLDEAYQKFEVQRKSIQERAKKFGLAEFPPEPFPKIRSLNLYQELGLFFAKVATFTFAVLFVLILLLPHIGAAVKNQLAPTAIGKLNHWALDFPTKLNARLDRVTPEEKEKMIEQWKKLINRTTAVKNIMQESAKK